MDPTTSTPGRTTRARDDDQARPGVELNEQAKAGPHGPPGEAGPARDGAGRGAAADDPAAALARVVAAPGAHARALAYGRLLGRIASDHTAVWDGACQRVVPLRGFYRSCLADPGRRATHTAELCRWATTADQPYARYPLIATTWRTA